MSRQARWQSRLACLWSVESLFPDLDRCEFFVRDGSYLPVHQDHAFLWTFTFADAACRSDPRRAMAVWQRFHRFLNLRKYVGVRGLERGGARGAYHFHAITPQEWPLTDVRLAAQDAGFGRIHVLRMPIDRVRYIAKYIGKPGRFPLPRGVRLWACFGFRGVAKNDVRCTINVLTPACGDVRPNIVSARVIDVAGYYRREILVRPDYAGDPAEIHIMKITKNVLETVARMIGDGKFVVVAEYRGLTVRTLEFDEVKKGIATGRRVVRKIVEHAVEIGAQQVKCSVWLPDDADPKSVVAPADKGEFVLVEIASMSAKYGISATSIVKLDNVGGAS